MAESNYTASSVVESLHGQPRYDLSLKTVGNEFEPDNQKYLESLALFACLYGVSALVAVIVVCCGCKKRRKREREEYSGGSSCSTNAIFICSIVAIVALPVYFWGNQESAKGVSSFVENVNDFQALFNDVFSTAESLQQNIGTARSVADNVTIPGGQDDTALNELKGALSAANNAVGAVMDNKDTLDTESILDTVQKGERYRWEIFMGFGIVLTLLVITYLLLRKPSKSSRTLLTWVGTMVAFIGLIVSGTSLAIAVGTADFCSGPNEVLIAYASPGDSSTMGDVASFYINCAPGSTNPFFDDVDDATKRVDESYGYIQTLSENGFDVADLNNSLNAVQNGTEKVLAETQCQDVHNTYIGAVDSLCVQCLPAHHSVLAQLVSVDDPLPRFIGCCRIRCCSTQSLLQGLSLKLDNTSQRMS
eukprot:m.401968 g.401968  ORF g.401968 m.401968 type:complete len:420 (+) comp21170_c1_seq22:108-1367(+)